MTLPPARDWLFSLKTFTASMLALYIALRLELPRPYWAMATVYIVSNPFVGATRSKALYRALGTMLGASAAVLFVPPFVESPYLFSFVVALWTGTLLYLAISDRTARSYVFMLAGYTMPLIALPAVTNPGRHLRSRHHAHRGDPARHRLRERRRRRGVSEPARADAHRAHRRLVSRRRVLRQGNALRAHRGRRRFPARRQRLAATVNQLEFLLSQLAYDHTRPDILARAHATARPHAVAAADHVGARRSADRAAKQRRTRGPEGLEALLADVVKWFDEPLLDASNETTRPSAKPTSCASASPRSQPPTAELATWEGALLSNALWRLKQVIDVWQDCRALRMHHRARRRRLAAALPALAARRLGALLRSRHAAVLGGLGGGGDLRRVEPLDQLRLERRRRARSSLAAVACCFFAALDEPAPQVFAFFVWTCASVVLAGLYLFVILPNVHDFRDARRSCSPCRSSSSAR